GVLFIRRAILFDDDAAWRHGALLLGLAANAKNEGLALLITVALALLLLRPRMLPRLWPSAALAAPWLILRFTHDLPTDIVAGSVIARFFARLHFAVPLAEFLTAQLFQPWLWVALLTGLLI